MSQARCSSAVAMLSWRTSLHSAVKGGAGRSQLLIQAFQASCSASSVKPGSSAQRTGTQRLLGWAIGAGNGPVSPGSTTAPDGKDGKGAGMAGVREGLAGGGL